MVMVIVYKAETSPMTMLTKMIVKIISRPSEHFSTMTQLAAKHRGTVLPFLTSTLDEL